MSPFGEEESALPSRQCTGSHVPGTDGQIQRIPLRIASHPAYSPDLALCDYFLFLNLKSIELPKLERRGDVPLSSRRRRARGSYHGWAVTDQREGSKESPQRDTVRRDAIYSIYTLLLYSVLARRARTHKHNVNVACIRNSVPLSVTFVALPQLSDYERRRRSRRSASPATRCNAL
ncbi:hypothetical protein ALC62_02208 [Cyphomyrmex costatus]|uniref:Histone-lysine N-methyltransferase SETMAR n=1 Tax=Cyphomyrmex costatus TaxID=456900 RepID=A0A195D1N2_9HYME|nr:hypothetical protein ALC62_02208 [Cyphomyrmex costatus]